MGPRMSNSAVLVVMNRKSQVYNTMKTALDLSIGIASQVILYSNLRNRNETLFANLLKKITAKLGGTDCVPRCENRLVDVPFAGRSHIVLGADINRPTVVNTGGHVTSVAALVGSRNPECTQYTGSFRYASVREEAIHGSGEMFEEAYDRWLNYSPRGERRHA